MLPVILLYFILIGEGESKSTYTDSVGACRTEDGGGKAGLTMFLDTECLERCNTDETCTGYVMGEYWCETYHNEIVTGDGREEFTCSSKDFPNGEDEDEQGDEQEGEGESKSTYTDSVGACRTEDGGKGGLTLFHDTECLERCNADETCTGYVMGDVWCETYHNEIVTGDGRKDFTCSSKDTENTGEDPDPLLVKTVYDEKSCRADAPKCNLRFKLRHESGKRVTPNSFEKLQICRIGNNGEKEGCKAASFKKKKQIAILRLGKKGPIPLSAAGSYVLEITNDGKENTSAAIKVTILEK